MSNVSRYCPSSCRFFVQSLEGEWWCDRSNIGLEDYDDNPVRSEFCYALAQAEEVVKNPRAAGYTPCGVCTDLGWVISDVPSANYYPVSDPSTRMGYCSKYATNLMTIKEPYRCKACMDAYMKEDKPNEAIGISADADAELHCGLCIQLRLGALARCAYYDCGLQFSVSPTNVVWVKRCAPCRKANRKAEALGGPSQIENVGTKRPSCVDCLSRITFKNADFGPCRHANGVAEWCMLLATPVDDDNSVSKGVDKILATVEPERFITLIPKNDELRLDGYRPIAPDGSVGTKRPFTIYSGGTIVNVLFFQEWDEAVDAAKRGLLGIKIGKMPEEYIEQERLNAEQANRPFKLRPNVEGEGIPINGCADCKDRVFVKDVHIGPCKHFAAGTCRLFRFKVQEDNGIGTALANIFTGLAPTKVLVLIPMGDRVELERNVRGFRELVDVSSYSQYPLTVKQFAIWPEAIDAVKRGKLGVRIREVKSTPNLNYSKFSTNPFGVTTAVPRPAPVPVEAARPVIDLVTVMPITLDLGDEEDVCIRLNAKDMDDES